tara:strand:+ start:20583 stop:21326 length:744 start_codon:yes stop_codon:yes gene_type:complete
MKKTLICALRNEKKVYFYTMKETQCFGQPKKQKQMEKKLKVLELFAGSRSFSKVAESNGFETFTTDFKNFEKIDYVVDILKFDVSKVPFKPDIIWASPPCTTFSIASCYHHWTKERQPKSDASKKGIEIVKKTLEIINHFNPEFFFIENPRGLLRKMDFMENVGVRNTITYCQYDLDLPLEQRRMKPTDIWTNHLKWKPRKMCKNGMKCHQSAPRGSRTGTQGIKGNYLRSVIPSQLCEEIIESLKK